MQKNNIKIVLRITTIIYLALFSFASSSYAAKYPELCKYLNKTASEQDKSRGENVRQIQIALIKERYANFGVASGFYGPKTTEAIKFFQSLNGIYPVGSTGPVTLAKMRSLWCSNSTASTSTNSSNTTSPLDTNNIKIDFSAKLDGSDVKLLWSSENTNYCKIDDEDLDSSGEKTVENVNATTTYTINCFNDFGVSAGRSLILFPTITTNTNSETQNDDWVDNSTGDSNSSDDFSDQDTSNQDYSSSNDDDWGDSNSSNDDWGEDNGDSSGDTSSDPDLDTTEDTTTVEEEIIAPVPTQSQGTSSSTTTSSTSSTTTSTVSKPTPTISSFKSTQTKVNNVQKVKFTWQTKNITSCKINGGVLKNTSVKANGSYEITAPKTTTTYSLICTNNSKNLTKKITLSPKVTVSVKTTTPTPTITLSATPAKITKTQKANLTWKTTGLTACSIDNNIGKVSNSGTKSVSITKTTTYTLTCKTTANKVYTKKFTLTFQATK